ncbi:SNF3 [[Candida] subhashii]|uniref:SNF3 n=1 Tax=[Candida] subhashii TaxID=561895 RepID=A0A8J5UDN6_9ASCO|nr:SNF3 [[Candida] subhashii]KAG7660498.1 SNF3 [[Candida] subhashii]
MLRQKSSSNSALMVGLVAAVGGFLYGYDTGLINDLLEMKYVYTTFPANKESFTTHERALITAILSLGTFCGALIAPLMSDNYGRKFSIIVSSGIIFNVGNVLQIASTEVALLCVGRYVSGLAVGILSAIVPLYQAEASPKWVRGSVVFTYQWAITWGLLIASAICQGTRRMPNSGSYRIPIGVQFLWTLILVTGMLFLPESPRYYVQKDNLTKALTSLSKLRRLPQDDEDLIEELVEIKANYDYEISFGRTSIFDCFRAGGGRHKQKLRMATGMGVQFFQQCSGVNFIFYYGVNFFASTGIQNFYIMSFATYLVNMIFTIPGIILVDTIGRRKLLFWGGIGMSVSNFIIAICGVSIADKEINAILSVSFSCLFIVFFASSWGGGTWALCSDIFSISIRQKAVALTAATNWLVNFIFAYITPYLIDTGNHTAAIGNKIFFIWGGCNALSVIFIYTCVYETKGLKLEEVDFMYAHCTSALSSEKFISTKIDYAKLDENYNPIAQTPPSTTSNNTTMSDELNTNEKDHHQYQQQNQPLYNRASSQANDELMIIPYQNMLSPVSTEENEEMDAHQRRRTSSSVASKQFSNSIMSNSTQSGRQPSQASNDYQSYLESLKREYSLHLQNSRSNQYLVESSPSSSRPRPLGTGTMGGRRTSAGIGSGSSATAPSIPMVGIDDFNIDREYSYLLLQLQPL